VVAQRHWGGANSLLIWLFRDRSNHPAAACGRGSPPYPRRGALVPSFFDETSLRQGSAEGFDPDFDGALSPS
jgi:hypothetical protein